MNPGSCRLDISATACRFDIIVCVNHLLIEIVRSCNYKTVVDEYKSWCEECSDWVSGKTGHDGNNGLRMIQEEPGEEKYSTRRSSLQRFTDSLEIADRSYRQPLDDCKQYLGLFQFFFWVSCLQKKGPDSLLCRNCGPPHHRRHPHGCVNVANNGN